MRDTLLSVDVEAAIRKLTDSQLSRPAMRPIELARALMAAGATSLVITRSRREIEMVAPGARVPAELLELLVLTLSTARQAGDRYAALLALEERGGLIWLALATEQGLEMELNDGGSGWTVDIRPGSHTLASRQALVGAPCRARLRRRGRGRAEQESFVQHLRYSRRPVHLDGVRIDTVSEPPPGALAGAVWGEGFEGWVRLRVDEDYSCIRWIDHEVLRAERYSQLAGGVAHEAVIHTTDPRARADAVLRVRDFRENTVAGLSRTYDALCEAEQEAVRRVLFARAIERRDVAVLGRARLFPTAGGVPLAVADLRERAKGAPLEAVGLAPRAGVGETALRLDAAGRRLVTEVLGLPIVGSVPIGTGSARERLERALREGWSDVTESVRAQWARLFRGRVVPPDALTVAERAFVQRLQELLASGTYRVPQLEPKESRAARVQVVPRGPLPLRPLSGRQPRLQLPRSHPTLQRVIRAHLHDPTTLYPALDLLFAGRDGWGSRRAQWRRAWLSSL